ncbi:MAG: hypothetical protein COA93_02495 [Alphaproteobacteria bacterium]|nr:MAG: hypothetical protein COA93_02495 [Alphaproteobacteria bacterium]
MERILPLVLRSVAEIGEERSSEELINATVKTKLFGTHGHLDSLGVVLLVSDLEDAIVEEFGKDIILADDRAMSQKTSPFRNVELLCAYIEKLLNEDET